MKIGVIGAMAEEISFLKEKIIGKQEHKVGPHIFYTGKIKENKVVVVQGGIGKVASALVFAAMIKNYPDIELCINIGVCGGVFGNINIGDIIIPDTVAYADVDATFFDNYKYGQMPGCPLIFKPSNYFISNLSLPPYVHGMILSGDSFFFEERQVSKLINEYFKDYLVLGFDMETAALAHCSYIYNIPFLAIRIVSDIISVEMQDIEYENNVQTSALLGNRLLLEILMNIGNKQEKNK